MIRKSNLLAIVATAALGLAMLSATEASARGQVVVAAAAAAECTAAATWAVIWAATWAVAATAVDVMSVIILIITRTGTLVIAARSGTAG